MSAPPPLLPLRRILNEGHSPPQVLASGDTQVLDTCSIVNWLRENKDRLLYTACYCEENIYKLAEMISEEAEENKKNYVVFISSLSLQTPIWKQKSAENNSIAVIWDYHVVLLLSNCLIVDFDSKLDFPCPAVEYYEEAFRPEVYLPDDNAQRFRVVPAQEFLEYFATDRSHMIGSKAPIPSWECLRGSKAGIDMNLSRFFDVSESSTFEHGKVMSKDQFLAFLTEA